MTAKGKLTEVLSFSIPKKMVKEVDRLTEDVGYSTRSELIRAGLRLLIKSKARVDGIEGRVEGVVIALYNYSVESAVSDIRHAHMDVIASFMHSDFHHRSEKCCDVLICKGKADKVRKLVYELEGTRDVEQVQLFVA